MPAHGSSPRKDRSRRYYEKHRGEVLARRATYMETNREDANGRRRTSRRERQAYVDEIKSSPCVDCGGAYAPYVMDLDHVRGEKTMNIARMVANAVSLARLQAEIDKCDLVCANCHRIRTHTRGQVGDVR